MKALKYVLWALGGIVVLAVIAVAIVAATFDPEKYKPEIVKLVKDRTGRTLAIDGKIGLTFFPKIGAAVDQVTLSEPGTSKTFAKVGEARVAVALIPLLSKQVIVDRVTLAGLSVDLVRYKDGRTNFGDLAGAAPAKDAEPSKAPGPAESGAGAPVLDIGGIALKDATVGWRDEREGTELRVSRLDLETGRIASGVPGKLSLSGHVEGRQPKLKLDVALATGYRVDFQTQAVALSGLDLDVKGDAPGLAGFEARARGDAALDPKAQKVDLAGFELTAKSKEGLDARFSIPKLALSPESAQSKAIDGMVKLARGAQALDAKLVLSAVEAKGKQVDFAALSADLNVKQGELTVQGKVTTPVSLNLAESEARLPKIVGDLALSGPDVPGRSVKLALTGSASGDWAKQKAQTDLTAKLDDSTIQAKVSIANFGAPAIDFDVAADQLNVDKYLPPKKAGPAGEAAGGAAKGGGASAGAEQPIDLSALKKLNANGTVRIGALTVNRIRAQNVQVSVRAAGGRVDANPIAANLYQGTLAGTASVNANANAFAVKQQMKGVSIGPLLRDAAEKDVLEGRGTVNLDVTTAGNSVTALKRGLNGAASLDLRDGAIKGVDIAGALRKARALFGSKDALEEQAKGGEKTDFSELTASFVIKNGVAHNDDLQGKSPLLRLGGAGDIDIGAGTMDYTVKATLAATSKGQGGRDVSELTSVTAPVRVTGPFENLKYRVDVGALARDAAKDTLTRELQRRLGGAPPGTQQGGQQQQEGKGGLGDALRGIFRR